MTIINKKALKRLPLHQLMDLKVDYAFKQLFGSEKNKEITVVFLNAILHKTGRDTIKEVVFLDKEVGGNHLDDKQSRLDIVVKTQAGEHINIEMQLSNQNNMMKRTLFYWSRLYIDQLQKGQGYHRLLPTITINICNFTLFTDTSAYHSTYHLHDHNHQRLNPEDDVLEIHFIEMNKFFTAWHADELNVLEDILVRWLLLLGMVDARKHKVYEEIYKELEELAMKDDRLIDAFTAWEELSKTQEEIIAYHSRLKVLIDEEAKLDYAEHKGIQKGIEQGIKQGLEQGKEATLKQLILKMIANGSDNEAIQALTEVSIEEIEALREQR